MGDDQRPLVLFHDECIDGLAAAWIAWQSLGLNADYQPVRYGDLPPPCADRVVYVLDFCFTPEQTAAMADEAARVVVLDHHQTAISRFASWSERPDVQLVFSNEHSGAVLAAEHFRAGACARWLANYVEDRDLWRFKLRCSREVNAFLAATILGVDPIAAFLELDRVSKLAAHEIYGRGEGVRLQVECYVRQMLAEAVDRTFLGHAKIPVINLPRPMTSEVLNELAKRAPFAAGWRVQRQGVVFSLRSVETSNVDCAFIAEGMGGGGHRHAAGFTVESLRAAATLLGHEELGDEKAPLHLGV